MNSSGKATFFQIDIDLRSIITCFMIPCAIERFPEKIGRFTPGSNIPIKDEQYARDNPPDAFLVLPYHFRDG